MRDSADLLKRRCGSQGSKNYNLRTTDLEFKRYVHELRQKLCSCRRVVSKDARVGLLLAYPINNKFHCTVLLDAFILRTSSNAVI
ncbi:hypothetical protein TNCV_2824121 [Trichonephila clavipes]|nr:hypothetical protein TNCV_2824121 [Trichonephila clavipes]